MEKIQSLEYWLLTLLNMVVLKRTGLVLERANLLCCWYILLFFFSLAIGLKFIVDNLHCSLHSLHPKLHHLLSHPVC